MFSNGQLVQAADLNNFSVTTVTTSGAVVVGTTLAVTGSATLASFTSSGTAALTTLTVSGGATLGDAVGDVISVAGTLTPLRLIDASGANAGQLKFPATQNASTNANTLDDYEEGLWTPVIGGSGGTSGQTYGTQYGRYIKIGKQVTAWFDCTLTAKGTITTNVEIQTLPFTSDSGGSVPYVCAVQWVALGTNWVTVQGFLTASGNVIGIAGANAAAAASNTNLATADITNTTTLRGCMIYVASA